VHRFGSEHTNGLLMAFCDGTVLLTSYSRSTAKRIVALAIGRTDFR
jgi:hypothetical protein